MVRGNRSSGEGKEETEEKKRSYTISKQNQKDHKIISDFEDINGKGRRDGWVGIAICHRS